MQVNLTDLARLHAAGTPKGICSVCSAHQLVLRAALRHGRQHNATVLVEATCNQVNHQGGYTGMTPRDFSGLVSTLAREEQCPEHLIVLGGDHLGPNPWKHLPAEQALAEAEKMVAAYVEAGFRKIHIDTSMGCQGEPAALSDELVSQRATRLIAVAEAAAARHHLPAPLYIIGTEVPPPGGADHLITTLEPTHPQAARTTLHVHREMLAEADLTSVLPRILGMVVQPGVEFGNSNVILYQREPARQLSALLDEEPHMVFEAHSTDYQGVQALSQLVEDGYAILKVGPELTFALREALFALDFIAGELFPEYDGRALQRNLEQLMLEYPDNWKNHYPGDEHQQHLLRHYSLSDRIRYYWAQPAAQQSVDRLLKILTDVRVPLPLIMQFMPGAEAFADAPLQPEEIVIWRITKVLAVYHQACRAD